MPNHGTEEEQRPSWLSAVRFRALLLLVAWLGAGVLLLYVADRVRPSLPEPAPWWIELLKFGAEACIAIGIGLLATHLFGNAIDDYIRELLQAAFTDRRFLRRLTEDARLQLIHNMLETVVPWCAEPLFALVVDTPHRKHHRLKRFPRYECELTDYPASRRQLSTDGKCPLSAANHFCVHFTEEYECDPNLFRGALFADFFIETAAHSEEGLRKAFLEEDPAGETIYRDLLFIDDDEVREFGRFVSSVGEREVAYPDHSVARFLSVTLSITFQTTLASQEQTARWETVELKPHAISGGNRIRLVWHKKELAAALAKLAPNAHVRVRLRLEFPIAKQVGFYPIVWNSFSCNPEVIVRFRTAENLTLRDVFTYLVAPDPRAFHIDRGFNNTELRLSSIDASGGKGAWLFPGSGIAMRWRTAKTRGVGATNSLPQGAHGP